MITTYVCKKCGKEKDLKSFSSHKKNGRRYMDSTCNACRNKVRSIKSKISKYGVTYDHYISMLESQDGMCKICNSHITIKTAQVDHDHHTMKARGLLCKHCNIMLGHAKDDISTLNNAIKYLKKYGK